MDCPNILYLLAALLVTIAGLRDFWILEEPKVNPAANDFENLKLQLQTLSWRLDQLENFIFKDDPPKPTHLPAPQEISAGQPELELDKPRDQSVHADPQREQKLNDCDAKVTRPQSELSKVKSAIQIFAQVATAPPSQRKAARIARSPVTIAEPNEPQILSCETHGQPLRSCLWVRAGVEGKSEVNVLGGDIDGLLESDRISADESGKCSLRIESITEEHFGTWACTLVDHTGHLFTGQIEINTIEKIPPTIYFGTSTGLQTYSVATSEVKDFGNMKDAVVAVTYDSNQDKIYWSSRDKVYRGNRDGAEEQIIYSQKEYGHVYALDFDWITGNIYGCGSFGYLFVCKTTSSVDNFVCATVLRGSSYSHSLRGIAVHSTEGYLFWTSYYECTISRAGMDGSGESAIVTWENYPVGITIDFLNSRLYWTCEGSNTVRSSDMHGRDIQTVLQRPRYSEPYGIGLSENRIYWTSYKTKRLESGIKTGEDINILHVGKDSFYHLAIVPRGELPSNRTNHCENRACSKVCVLTPTSFSCLS